MRTSINHKPEKVKLSILICTIKGREDTLKELIDELLYQIQSLPVQVLWLGDNKSMSTGRKRNKLLSIADGDYICFIDDDDLPSPEYIKEILSHLNEDKDVITFWAKRTPENHQYRYSSRFTAIRRRIKENGEEFYGYLPGHLNVWKKSLCVEFPDLNVSEDHRWTLEMSKIKTSEVHIEKELYYYRHGDGSITKRR